MNSTYLILSPNCNLKCKYCFQLENLPELSGSADYHHQVGLKAKTALIDSFVEFCRREKIDHVEFFGGEPLLYANEFQYAVEKLCQLDGMSLGVITNGTLITERTMTLFEAKPISVLLSLDGDREYHNRMRGGFERITPWIPRLVQRGRVTVAMQAGEIGGLYHNIRYIWSLGLKKVYVNLIENYGWYSEADIASFEMEYEDMIRAMLRSEGELSCALQLHSMLQQPIMHQGCGITRLGRACDWHGLLYPCHRAVELGPEFAIGDIFSGIDEKKSRLLRSQIDQEAFHSSHAQQFPLVSFCPVAIYQKSHKFSGEWNPQYSEMITIKAKLVSKYYFEISAYVKKEKTALNGVPSRSTLVSQRPVLLDELQPTGTAR